MDRYSPTGVKRTLHVPAYERRDLLINEVTNIADLGACFDLRAFPLPVRVGPWHDKAGYCFWCVGEALHVYMRILPRGQDELYGIARDEAGTLELNTCSLVTRASFAKEGPAASVEKVRVAVKNMVLHEVYEALLFRGERIMDPHDNATRPADQPF